MYKFYNQLNDDIKNIREEVFIKEQKFTEEFDKIDQNAIHILYFYNNLPVGTARLYNTKEEPKVYNIGRVAILKEYRKHGLGKAIIKALEEKAKEVGASKIALSAQKEVEGFYMKNGYIPQGEPYFDEWCLHIKMIKNLQ